MRSSTLISRSNSKWSLSNIVIKLSVKNDFDTADGNMSADHLKKVPGFSARSMEGRPTACLPVASISRTISAFSNSAANFDIAAVDKPIVRAKSALEQGPWSRKTVRIFLPAVVCKIVPLSN